MIVLFCATFDAKDREDINVYVVCESEETSLPHNNTNDYSKERRARDAPGWVERRFKCRRYQEMVAVTIVAAGQQIEVCSRNFQKLA